MGSLAENDAPASTKPQRLTPLLSFAPALHVSSSMFATLSSFLPALQMHQDRKSPDAIIDEDVRQPAEEPQAQSQPTVDEVGVKKRERKTNEVRMPRYTLLASVSSSQTPLDIHHRETPTGQIEPPAQSTSSARPPTIPRA